MCCICFNITRTCTFSFTCISNSSFYVPPSSTDEGFLSALNLLHIFLISCQQVATFGYEPWNACFGLIHPINFKTRSLFVSAANMPTSKPNIFPAIKPYRCFRFDTSRIACIIVIFWRCCTATNKEFFCTATLITIHIDVTRNPWHTPLIRVLPQITWEIRWTRTISRNSHKSKFLHVQVKLLIFMFGNIHANFCF